MVTIISILLLSFVSFLFYDVYYNTRKIIRDEITLVARVISKRAAPVMLFEDEMEGLNVISEASVKNSVILACLYTSRKTLLSQYKDEEATQITQCPALAPKEEGVISEMSTIAIHKPVYSPNGDRVASIYIVSDMRQVLAKLYNTSLGALLFLLIAIWLSYVLVIKLTTFITTPITNLAKTAKSVSRNNYSARATKMYDDECGLLTDTFNDMMQKVENHKTLLNQIVNKKTKDLRQTVEKLKKANTELEKANNLKQIWIQNMGHEIRTPIHQVLQFSEFGVSEYEDKDVSRKELGDYFERIKISANRLCKLIEDLLDFGKLQSGKINIIPEKNDLKPVIEEVVEELRSLADEKKITLSISEIEVPTESVFDSNRISQVLINLIVNAIKFSPEGEIIEIKVDQQKRGKKQFMRISVIDHGIGIPDGEEEDIFDTFRQSSKTFDGSGGTGLGLSISKEIVLIHGGNIHAKNNGKDIPGAAFIFTLPYKTLSS